MRYYSLVAIVLMTGLFGCKNNGQDTASAKAKEAEKNTVAMKQIIVDPNRKPTAKPDFQVLEMTNEKDVLTVVVRYSGGCEEHDFNAYFSGGWLKSMPPQAIVEFEHLNPKKDACRSLVKDTFLFDMKPLQYSASSEVVVKWSGGQKIQTSYTYSK